MRILVVEDNHSLADSIERSMRQMDHAVDVAGEGDTAEELLAIQSYDLVILDLNLPQVDGLTILASLRRRGNNVPVLVLTARSQLEDRIRGLDRGADDYLTKPFELAELEARVRALLRRRADRRSPLLDIGPLTFDTVSRTVLLEGLELELTPRERAVLEVLINNAGNVVSKEQISEHLYSFDDEAGIATVELYVHRLRKKLDDKGSIVRTVRGLGYILDA